MNQKQPSFSLEQYNELAEAVILQESKLRTCYLGLILSSIGLIIAYILIWLA